MEVVNQLTKITLAWELFEQAIPKAHIANQLGVTREIVHIWIKGIQKLGLLEFLENYVDAKKVREEKGKLMDYLKPESTG